MSWQSEFQSLDVSLNDGPAFYRGGDGRGPLCLGTHMFYNGCSNWEVIGAHFKNTVNNRDNYAHSLYIFSNTNTITSTLQAAYLSSLLTSSLLNPLKYNNHCRTCRWPTYKDTLWPVTSLYKRQSHLSKMYWFYFIIWSFYITKLRWRWR